MVCFLSFSLFRLVRQLFPFDWNWRNIISVYGTENYSIDILWKPCVPSVKPPQFSSLGIFIVRLGFWHPHLSTISTKWAFVRFVKRFKYWIFDEKLRNQSLKDSKQRIRDSHSHACQPRKIHAIFTCEEITIAMVTC